MIWPGLIGSPSTRPMLMTGQAPLTTSAGSPRAAQSTADLDTNTLGTGTHGVLYGALHGATEHDATLELLSHTLGSQGSIQVRLAHLFNIDVYRHPDHGSNFLAQGIDILTFFANHNARTSGVNGDTRRLGRTLDLDSTDGSMRQLPANMVAHLQITQQLICVLAALGIPDRIVLFNDSQSNTGGMYLLTHISLLAYSSATFTVM